MEPKASDMERTHWANCAAPVSGAFCSGCGQRRDIPEFSWHYLLVELPAGIFAVDKGIVHTVKSLFTRPGHAIREYLEGKRIQHFRPFSLLVLSAGLYGFIALFFDLRFPEFELGTQEKSKEIIDTVNQHYALVELVLLPVLSVSTWLFFRRSGYNYVEHMVINAFLASQRVLVTVALLPFMFAVNGTYGVVTIASLGNVASFVLFIWSMTQLFQQRSATSVAFRSMAAFGLSYVFLTLFVILGGVLYAILRNAG